MRIILDDKDKRELGSSIALDIDESTWVMTLSLLNMDNEVISTKTIDFPIESSIVNATYDKETESMTFTLQSGKTVTVPIGDLINGLVPDTRKVGGVDLKDDVTVEELQENLGIVNLNENYRMAIQGVISRFNGQSGRRLVKGEKFSVFEDFDVKKLMLRIAGTDDNPYSNPPTTQSEGEVIISCENNLSGETIISETVKPSRKGYKKVIDIPKYSDINIEVTKSSNMNDDIVGRLVSLELYGDNVGEYDMYGFHENDLIGKDLTANTTAITKNANDISELNENFIVKRGIVTASGTYRIQFPKEQGMYRLTCYHINNNNFEIGIIKFSDYDMYNKVRGVDYKIISSSLSSTIVTILYNDNYELELSFAEPALISIEKLL